MSQFAKVILKPGKEDALRRFHPWVFSGAINKIKGSVNEGDTVIVCNDKDDFIAMGHYQIGSIAVRVFSFIPEDPTYEFWKEKINHAVEIRTAIGLPNDQTNVFRLVHGEGDGLPGMVVDYYNGLAVLQFHSVGMYRLREMFSTILKEIFGKDLIAVYDKSSRTLPFKAGLNAVDEFLTGSCSDAMVRENGLFFKIDWVRGQKTGFYIDQRDNRKLLQNYASGRDVLNLFSYTGGFSVNALRGGARFVHGVDSSSPAIELEKENVAMNFPGENRHEVFLSDVADFLKNIKDKYNLIVIDPPAFSKHRESLPKALQAYKRLNEKAVESIRSGGIIFTFSCSQVVSPGKFREAVFSGATITGRKVRIMHQLFQPPDHPVDIYHPEGEYLKGLVLYVE